MRWLLRLVVAVLIISYGVTTRGAEQALPVVCASTPTLADLTAEVGREIVRVEPLWNGLGETGQFKAEAPTREKLRTARLVVGYGVPPFKEWEDALKEEAGETPWLVAGASEALRSLGDGELALSPEAGYQLAGTVADKLKELWPDAAPLVDRNLARLRADLTKAVLGEKLVADLRPEEDLRGRFSVSLALVPSDRPAPANLGGWARRLHGFQGLPVTDARGLLDPLGRSFTLYPPSAPASGAKPTSVSPVGVTWAADETAPPSADAATAVLPVKALADSWTDGYLARIEAVVRALEGPLAVARVRTDLAIKDWGVTRSSRLVCYDERHLPELMAVMKDPTRRELWISARWGLAYIGDDRAWPVIVEPMEAALKSDQAMEGQTVRLVVELPMVLGVMAQRSDKAYEYLNQGCEEAFWEARIHPKVRGGGWTYDKLVRNMAERCLQSVAMSGKKDHQWVADTVARYPKSFWDKAYSAIIQADSHIWWQETYGMDDFRQELLGPKGTARWNEWKKTARAKELCKRVMPGGQTLSDRDLAD